MSDGPYRVAACRGGGVIIVKGDQNYSERMPFNDVGRAQVCCDSMNEAYAAGQASRVPVPEDWTGAMKAQRAEDRRRRAPDGGSLDAPIMPPVPAGVTLREAMATLLESFALGPTDKLLDAVTAVAQEWSYERWVAQEAAQMKTANDRVAHAEAERDALAAQVGVLRENLLSFKCEECDQYLEDEDEEPTKPCEFCAKARKALSLPAPAALDRIKAEVWDEGFEKGGAYHLRTAGIRDTAFKIDTKPSNPYRESAAQGVGNDNNTGGST